MERYPRPLKEKELNNYNDWIRDNAMGNPVILDSAPTKATDLKPNTQAMHGDDLYVRDAKGVLRKFTGTIIEE